MMEWFNSLLAVATTAVAQHSVEALVALFLIAALMEVGMPFPFIVDGVLLVSSYESGMFSYQVLLIILALVLGREVGATVIFWLSRFVGDKFINWLAKRLPKLKLKEKMVWLNTKLRKRAPLAVAIARLTPGLLTPSSVAAGCSGIQYYQFVLGIVLASAVTDGALITIGFITRYSLSFLGFIPTTWELVLAIAAGISLIWGIRWLWLRRRDRIN
jgi:membrane protein DedA with SNARE-associated domain